jgi:hypothetical protein
LEDGGPEEDEEEAPKENLKRKPKAAAKEDLK